MWWGCRLQTCPERVRPPGWEGKWRQVACAAFASLTVKQRTVAGMFIHSPLSLPLEGQLHEGRNFVLFTAISPL